MEMLNRAIEDASDFTDMMKKLDKQDHADTHLASKLREQVDRLEKANARPVKRPGENRVKYRSRVYGGGS